MVVFYGVNYLKVNSLPELRSPGFSPLKLRGIKKTAKEIALFFDCRKLILRNLAQLAVTEVQYKND